MPRIASLCAALIVAGSMVGCADFPARVRRHTYPPDFRYIPRAEVRSVMWQLAAHVSELDRAMREPGPMDDARRTRIAGILSGIDDSARALEAGGRPTNHPLLAENLEGFRQAVAAARASVSSGRQDYYLVGSVSGACLACHGPDR